MDLLDVKILRLLWNDGRMPVYRIAENLGISGAAVDKRINAMMKRGELLGFSILLNSDYVLNSAVISIHAKKRRERIFERVSKIPGVMHFVGCLGGRYYGEFWYSDEMELREKLLLFKELTDSYSEDIFYHRNAGEKKIDRIDWKILLAMRDDARIPFSKLSKIIGISAKTISKRWERLVSEDVVKAYPIVNRPFSKDILWFSLFIEVDDIALEGKIKKMDNIWRTSIFEDPKIVYGVFFAQFVREIDYTMERVVCMKGVKKVHYEIIVEEKFNPEYLNYVSCKLGFCDTHTKLTKNNS